MQIFTGSTGKVTCQISLGGKEVWYKDDKFHRENGPAIINPDGSEYWYKDGKQVK